MSITRLLIAVRQREDGVAGVEYALLASAVALTLVGGMVSLGNGVEAKYSHVEAEYADAAR